MTRLWSYSIGLLHVSSESASYSLFSRFLRVSFGLRQLIDGQAPGGVEARPQEIENEEEASILEELQNPAHPETCTVSLSGPPQATTLALPPSLRLDKLLTTLASSEFCPPADAPSTAL